MSRCRSSTGSYSVLFFSGLTHTETEFNEHGGRATAKLVSLSRVCVRGTAQLGATFSKTVHEAETSPE